MSSYYLSAIDLATASKDALTLEDIIRKAYICLAPILTEVSIHEYVAPILYNLVDSLVCISDIQFETPFVQKTAATIIMQGVRLAISLGNAEKMQKMVNVTHHIYKRIKRRVIQARKKDSHTPLRVEDEFESLILYLFSNEQCCEVIQALEIDAEGCYDEIMFKVVLQAHTDTNKSIDALSKQKDNPLYSQALLHVVQKLIVQK